MAHSGPPGISPSTVNRTSTRHPGSRRTCGGYPGPHSTAAYSMAVLAAPAARNRRDRLSPRPRNAVYCRHVKSGLATSALVPQRALSLHLARSPWRLGAHTSASAMVGPGVRRPLRRRQRVAGARLGQGGVACLAPRSAGARARGRPRHHHAPGPPVRAALVARQLRRPRRATSSVPAAAGRTACWSRGPRPRPGSSPARPWRRRSARPWHSG